MAAAAAAGQFAFHYKMSWSSPGYNHRFRPLNNKQFLSLRMLRFVRPHKCVMSHLIVTFQDGLSAQILAPNHTVDEYTSTKLITTVCFSKCFDFIYPGSLGAVQLPEEGFSWVKTELGPAFPQASPINLELNSLSLLCSIDILRLCPVLQLPPRT